MENKRHLNQVESLRAFAAIAVSIFHFSAFFKWNESTTTNFTVGAQGVEVFYLISGFIIPYSLYHSSYLVQNYFKYMGKRLIRLMPPYIVTIIGIILLNIFMSKVYWDLPIAIDWAELFANVFFLADLFPSINWMNEIFATLEVELQFYILIGLLFPLFKSKPWTFPVICIVLLTLGRLTIDIDTVLVNSPYFICGMSLFFIKEKGWKVEYYLPVVASFISMYLFYYWEDIGAAAIGFLFLYFVPASFRFFNFTGRISYSYYLTHGLTGVFFLSLTNETEFAVSNPLLMMLFAFMISWAGAFAMYWIIERPSMKLSKKIKYQKLK